MRLSNRLRAFLVLAALVLAAVAADAADATLAGTKPRLMTQAGHNAGLMVAQSISPNGQLVATADDTSIKIWNVDLGKLVCAMLVQKQASRPSGSGAKAALRSDSSEEADGDMGMAWAADSASLYLPFEGNILVRYDLRACARAESVRLSLPEPPKRPRKDDDTGTTENDIEELSTLKDGRILARTPSALYAITLVGQRASATLLASLQVDKPLQPKLRLEDLFTAEGKQRLMERVLDQLDESSIGAHSADGRVVVLTPKVVHMGPVFMQMSASEPLVVNNGVARWLSSFQGAAGAFKGASVVAVSASGRWLAVRSAAPGGAQISLFDVPAGRQTQSITLVNHGGAKMSTGPLTALMSRQNEQARVVAGMVFSADEQHLVLVRQRTDAQGEQPDDPTLELRRTDSLAVAQRVNLRGVVVPPNDFLTGMSSHSGNAAAASADQSGFVFQNTSFFRGATMAAVHWKGSQPQLATWAATEGPVHALHFANDGELLSTHVWLRGKAVAPPAGRPAVAGAIDPSLLLSSMNQGQQTVRWSFASGDAQTVHSVMSLPASANLTYADFERSRVLRADTRYVEPMSIVQEVVMQALSGGSDLWRQSFTDADGSPRGATALAMSQDGRLVAALLKRSGPPRAAAPGVGASAAPSPAPVPAQAQAQAQAAAPRESSRSAALLGSLLGGALGERLKQILPPASTTAPSPAAPVAAPAGGRPATTARAETELALLDANTGEVLARLGLDKGASSATSVHFINGQRLLVGVEVFDWQRNGDKLYLAASPAQRLPGPLLGVTPVTGRPILARTGADPRLRALVLPANLSQASLAVSSVDDRLLAVEVDGQVSLLDGAQGMKLLFRPDLQGAAATALALAPGGRHLAVGTAEGSVRLFDLSRQAAVATLLSLSDASWAVVDAEGRYDASNLGNNPALHWVFADEPLRALPFEAAMRPYYTPRLLPLLLDDPAKLRPVPPLQAANRVAPKVEIERVEAMVGKPGLVNVTVTVSAQANAKGQSSGAADLRLFRNGQLVGHAPRNDGPLALDATGRHQRVFEAVRLPEGAAAVEFSAYAFNTDQMRSAVAQRRFVPATAVPGGPRRAFVIAVGTNTTDSSAWPRLSFAVNDARLIRQSVSEGLLSTGAYAEVISVTLESDNPGRADATKARVAAALGLLAGRPDSARMLIGVPGAERLQAATPSDLVVFSFAGHGYVSEANRELHLVPSDIAPSAEGAGLSRFDASAISALDLERWLRDVDAGQFALVVDACRSAAAIDEAFKAGPMGSRGLGQLAYDKGARILTATQAAEDALESASLRHGLLTFALIEEGLRAGKADLRPRDKRVDMLEWLSFAAERVPGLHAALQKGQPIEASGRSWSTERAASRPAVAAAAAAAAAAASRAPAKVQTPKLFDFIAAGRPQPVVSHLP